MHPGFPRLSRLCCEVCFQTDFWSYADVVEETSDDVGRRQRPPYKAITPNMLVAYNTTRWRKASAMTQEELGKKLGGWTKRAVSAAERSWEGTRVRQFDADLIADLASIFRVPVPAFFLPPADDQDAFIYVIQGDDGGHIPMGDYFSMLMPEPDFEADSAAGTAYQQAVITATALYQGSEAGSALADAAGELATRAELQQYLTEAREMRGTLNSLYGIIDDLRVHNEVLQGALERALRKGDT
jgi:transcriptional regulator with XRE-family HTH domain